MSWTEDCPQPYHRNVKDLSHVRAAGQALQDGHGGECVARILLDALPTIRIIFPMQYGWYIAPSPHAHRRHWLARLTLTFLMNYSDPALTLDLFKHLDRGGSIGPGYLGVIVSTL